MAPGDKTPGRRLPDVEFGELPDGIQPGDYWKYLDRETGEAYSVDQWPTNLTGTAWGFQAPRGGIGTLMKHTVREHDDGTISVRSGDGSSNSILQAGGAESWHGYVEHGEWQEV